MGTPKSKRHVVRTRVEGIEGFQYAYFCHDEFRFVSDRVSSIDEIAMKLWLTEAWEISFDDNLAIIFNDPDTHYVRLSDEEVRRFWYAYDGARERFSRGLRKIFTSY
jgi:hypothetical protein